MIQIIFLIYSCHGFGLLTSSPQMTTNLKRSNRLVSIEIASSIFYTEDDHNALIKVLKYDNMLYVSVQ